MAAFQRLIALGEGPFKSIVQMLQHGTPASDIARIIRTDWGELQDVREDSLAKQLTRLNGAVQDGAFSEPEALNAAIEDVRRQLESVSTVDCLTRLEELAQLMREYVLQLLEIQRTRRKPMRAVDVAMTNYRRLLVTIQETRFNLGLDEYHGPRSGRIASQSQKAASQDYWTRYVHEQRVIADAYATAEEILRKPLPKT